MEFLVCELLVELVPVAGYLARKHLLEWPLSRVQKERRRCNQLVAQRSEHLRALEAQGVDLMALYREMYKTKTKTKTNASLRIN